MGNQLRAELDVMSGISSQFSTHYDSLQAAITHLQGEAEMHSATWDGKAKRAWSESMTGVNTAWNKINNLLNEITSHIKDSGVNYDSGDEENAGGMRSVPTGDITAAMNR